MIMLTPMKQIGSWAVKQLTMSALKATLDSHNNAGGTYTVCTPAFIYTDMLMVGVTDVSMAQSPIPQNAWRWDFTKPLVTLADTSGAMNNLMNQINSGAQPSAGGSGTSGGDPTGGTPSTSDPATAIGQPASIMNTGAGAGATAPGASILPFIGPTGGNIFDTPVSPFSGATSDPVSGGDFISQNPGSQRPPPGTLP